MPKKNHDALVKNLKKFVPWFDKRGIRLEYYRLGGGPTMEGPEFENVAKTLAAGEEEDAGWSCNTTEIASMQKTHLQK